MAQVQKWGNSLGIRIPKTLAMEVGLEEAQKSILTLKTAISSSSHGPINWKIYFRKYRLIISIPRFKLVIREDVSHDNRKLHS
ncbi:AbrB/MazE/SpoVT family DNA-binding domain-containing protein [Paenibacillus sp. p3-SID867]|uniref:AbrB/MazE/SpoVT family DNA-binding domain-containing protein n=1 Tax=Paenibacillus sp. p3-SID867 TaxID=2916363 RepID=UPI0021A79D4D|nr:AbrB/MazE/SpoVT family DNA-binding domain-containing protein [Paenibacillus sp. p3-SID867]MCT1398468.1 AbrB/MazE/SpoVT family DNA-binding domain-containing protein [Paenibacillus sp. p3-SID867]